MTYQAKLNGTAIVTVVQADDPREGWVSIGGPVNWADRPTLNHYPHLIDGAVVWQDNRILADVKAARVALMRVARDAAINGTFTWDGSAFDADQVSQTRILGLKVASTDAGFTSQAWRLADNTWRTLSAADAADVWTALQAHLAGHFATFAAREAAIAAATTVAAVDLITWA
jgi:hypothetical protein